MDKKIQKFVEGFIPENIDYKTKENIINELASHIYDKVDYFIEQGLSETESLEKAFSSFAEKEETKNKLREDFFEIHHKKSLADLLVIAIPILIITKLLLYVFAYKYSLTFSSVFLFGIIPLIYLIPFKKIQKSDKFKAITKSIISLILVITMISAITLGSFMSTDLMITTYKNEEALEFAEYMFCFNADEPITTPESCRLYYSEIIQFLDNEEAYNLILKYNDDDYKKEIERIKNCFNYNTRVFNGETIYNSTEFEAYGFKFYCVYDIPTDFERESLLEYYEECWCFIGINDKTNEIAYIEYAPYEFTPTFNSRFLKNKCGWKYFYYKHLIYN